jgi:hypothetical protein
MAQELRLGVLSRGEFSRNTAAGYIPRGRRGHQPDSICPSGAGSHPRRTDGSSTDARSDARSFNQCVAKAKAHRARQQPAALLKELLAELAGKRELAEAQVRLGRGELALRVFTRR